MGVGVFDRGDEFDPRLDPIVRVQARNLRVRLAQYYAGPGAEDAVIIELPKRTYVPVFHSRPQAVAAPVEEPGPESVADAPQLAVADAAPISEVVAAPTSVAVQTVPETAMVRTEAASAAPATQSSPRRSWLPAGWASITAAVVLTVLATTAFWRVRPAETAKKAIHEPDPVAQDLYIRGRYLMDRETEPALRESIDAFNSAIKRDPQFAPAYAGLADSYNVLAQFGYITPSEGMEQARRAAEQALDIDPALAEAHVSLAAIIEAYDWNWAEAEREYRRALDLNPGLAEAHMWYGMFLRDQGRIQEALPEMRRAAQLEPFSVFSSINLAHAYMMAGNYAAAEEQARHAASLAPEMVTAQVVLSNAYRAQSRTAEADAALARAEQFSQGNPHAISVLACAYARLGKRDEGMRLFQQLESLSKQRYVSPFDLGSVSLVLGDEKHALDLMEEAYRQRSSGLIFLRDAKFDRLHRSPGFDSLIQKMHFAG